MLSGRLDNVWLKPGARRPKIRQLLADVQQIYCLGLLPVENGGRIELPHGRTVGLEETRVSWIPFALSRCSWRWNLPGPVHACQ